MPSSRPPSAGVERPPRRKYDSEIRRHQMAETRERIVAAGEDLVRSLPTWDWSQLNFRTVAERGRVSSRTVYRHFTSERELRDAVMRRLEEKVGVSYDDLSLDGIADTTARILASLSSFAAAPIPTEDPTFVSTDQIRKDALLRAVREATSGWSKDERAMAAGMLDVTWHIPSFERLVGEWGLEPGNAAGAVLWVIRLIVEAVHAGRGPKVQ
jgi:AcrR family transcriptional regulator